MCPRGACQARTLINWSARMSRKTEKSSRQTQRDSARAARLEAVARTPRRSARRRTAVIVAASVTAVGRGEVSSRGIGCGPPFCRAAVFSGAARS